MRGDRNGSGGLSQQGRGDVKNGSQDMVAQGQLQPSGDLVLPEQKGQAPGEITAIIDLVDDISAYNIPAGSTAQVAAYTDHWRHLMVVRQILLRMKSWLNYLTFPN